MRLSQAIAGGVGALAAALAPRLFFGQRHESRAPSPGIPGRVRGSAMPDHGTAPWHRQQAETGGRSHAESRAGRAVRPDGVQSQAIERLRGVGMGTGDQVREFVIWELAELEALNGARTHGRLNDVEVWNAYRRWIARFDISPVIPRDIFLKVLAKHPQVERKRDLVLDSRGRSIPNPGGRSKKRDTYYYIRPPRKETVLPGKVPVGELVPKQVVPTKSQRDAERAAKAAQPAASQETEQPLPQPMRRAA